MDLLESERFTLNQTRRRDQEGDEELKRGDAFVLARVDLTTASVFKTVPNNKSPVCAETGKFNWLT